MRSERHGAWMHPDWPAASHTGALVTSRRALPELGASRGPFGAAGDGPGLNLGLKSGDDVDTVLANRAGLERHLGVPLHWLDQVHGNHVVRVRANDAPKEPADASWTDEKSIGLAILVADCMPVLFADREGRVVAAAHAGWRGLAAGVLEETVKALPVPVDSLLAFLGPAIGPEAFEVGGDVLDAFVAKDPGAASGFVPKVQGKWFADLPFLARRQLDRIGVSHYGEAPSTFADPERFYSFRRDKITGRMAGVIWLR